MIGEPGVQRRAAAVNGGGFQGGSRAPIAFTRDVPPLRLMTRALGLAVALALAAAPAGAFEAG
jgi:hypothetical protein